MKKKLTAIILSLAMALSLSASVLAAENFTDVPTSYWACTEINTLYEGGMINGYGNGKFGPTASFSIAHMATIICNAKGYETGAKDGYWAGKAVDYCVNTLYCLPSQGAINDTNYGKNCTRELAIYMLMKGLGATNQDNYHKVEPSDIPDYGQISQSYRSTILEAYRYGVTNGTDSKGTFNPQGTLTRAQAAVIMYRAGYTKATAKPTTTTTLSNQQIFDKIKAMNLWSTKTLNGVTMLTAKDAKYGGLKVEFIDGADSGIDITMPEYNDSAWYNSAGQLVDLNGNHVSDTTNSAGLFVCSTGYSYTARQLLLSILKIAYPKSYASAYDAVKQTFLENAWETSSDYPSTARWIDGRYFGTSMPGDGSYKFSAYIGVENDKEVYNDDLAGASSGRQWQYGYKVGGFEAGKIAYELNKW
jgi:hypothetical protein